MSLRRVSWTWRRTHECRGHVAGCLRGGKSFFSHREHGITALDDDSLCICMHDDYIMTMTFRYFKSLFCFESLKSLAWMSALFMNTGVDDRILSMHSCLSDTYIGDRDSFSFPQC